MNSDDSHHYSDNDDGRFCLRNAVVDELGSNLKKSLKIVNYDNDEEEEGEEDNDITEVSLVQMGYGKTKTRDMPSVQEEDEDITDSLSEQMDYGKIGPPKHEPPPIPIPAANLKSAMKGSSKKEELPPDKEKKVTWADDVYDPTPSAASNFAINTIVKHGSENRKSWKNRRKWGGIRKSAGGGAAKGGKDKQKKHAGRGSKWGNDKDKKRIKYSGSSKNI